MLKVAGRYRSCQRLVAVRDSQNDVRLQHLENCRHVENTQSRGTGHARRRVAFDDNVTGGVRLETFRPHQVHDAAEAIEERRGAGHDLEL